MSSSLISSPSDSATKNGVSPPLLRLVYTSRAMGKPPNPTTIEQLLRSSRRRNQQTGLTGLLMQHHAHFIQCLEGASDDVYATLGRIQQDPRHVDVTVRSQDMVESRAFGSWFMAYVSIGEKTWAMLERVDWQETEAYTYSDEDHAGELSRGFALLERVWEMYRYTLQADRGPPED